MKTLAIVVNGKPRTGKDTFVDLVVEALQSRGFTASKASSVDCVKEAAYIVGWNGIKDEVGRKFLSDLKDLSTAAFNGPLKYMLGKMVDQGEGVCFFMIREPEEIAKFVKTVPTTITFKVERQTDEPEFQNHADQRVNEYNYDHIIKNNGTLEDLKQLAEDWADVLASRITYEH